MPDELALWAMLFWLWLAFWLTLRCYRRDLARLIEAYNQLKHQDGEIGLARKQKLRLSLTEIENVRLKRRIRELEGKPMPYEIRERH